MKRTARAPRQLPLFSTAGLGPADDPVGTALGVDLDDVDGFWREMMGQFARVSVRAYHEFRAGSDEPFYWWLVVDTTPDYRATS